jgi:hypothetical protein
LRSVPKLNLIVRMRLSRGHVSHGQPSACLVSNSWLSESTHISTMAEEEYEVGELTAVLCVDHISPFRRIYSSGSRRKEEGKGKSCPLGELLHITMMVKNGLRTLFSEIFSQGSYFSASLV